MGKIQKKQLILWLSGVLYALSLCGCSRWFHYDSGPATCRVVESIDIYYENGPLQFHRVYTASDKMQSLLNYLRLINPYGTPVENPETAEGSTFRIIMNYANGCQKTYLQKSDRFLLVEGQPWRNIDSKKAQELSRIVGVIESDLLE